MFNLLGGENVATDALTQDNLSVFFAQMLQVPRAPTVVVQELEQLFLHQHPDWLETSVQHFLAAGPDHDDSTAKAYAVGQRRYLELCQQTSLVPCPASEHQLILFAAFVAGHGLQWQTIKSYLAAVHNLHIRARVHFPGQDKSLPRWGFY